MAHVWGFGTRTVTGEARHEVRGREVGTPKALRVAVREALSTGSRGRHVRERGRKAWVRRWRQVLWRHAAVYRPTRTRDERRRRGRSTVAVVVAGIRRAARPEHECQRASRVHILCCGAVPKVRLRLRALLERLLLTHRSCSVRRVRVRAEELKRRHRVGTPAMTTATRRVVVVPLRVVATERRQCRASKVVVHDDTAAGRDGWPPTQWWAQ
jgi:hypothetical protein